ncbi:MAG: DUF4396 domain-containing protein [Nevskia sp.]
MTNHIPAQGAAPDAAHDCCAHAAGAPAAAARAPAAHGAHGGNGWRGAASVTGHCLTGCAIGELTGLAIGVGLGFPVARTITLAVLLSFASGFALTLLPMLRRGLSIGAAFATVWLGEVISIGVMELVMNLVDYHMGGMRGVSLTSARYWEAFILAAIAGFIAAWPVNRWMLGRNMKRCH